MNGTEMKLEPGSRHQLVGGNLVIMNPSKAQDAGVYQCLASNPVGTIVSREAVLRFGCETHGVPEHFGEGKRRARRSVQKGQETMSHREGPQAWRTVPECPVFTPVLQEFSKEERDPVKTHEGWGVMLPCNPPAHYPGEWGPGPQLHSGRGRSFQHSAERAGESALGALSPAPRWKGSCFLRGSVPFQFCALPRPFRLGGP